MFRGIQADPLGLTRLRYGRCPVSSVPQHQETNMIRELLLVLKLRNIRRRIN